MFLTLDAAAATLNGTVNNGTTHRPAAGNEVVLLTVSEAGMTEGARSKTDSAGRFSLPVSDSRMDTVIQVSHQGVTYTQVASPGVDSLTVEVFDSATQLDDIHTVMDVRRLQANGESLQVTQLITVRNESRPSRTLVGDSTLEVEVPPEAHVEAAMTQAPGGKPVWRPLSSRNEKGRYYFAYPLRPGDTRFMITYTVPYTGDAVIQPSVVDPQERFAVILPKSMKFESSTADVFQPVSGVTRDTVLMTSTLKPGQSPRFRVSGVGALAEFQETAKQTDSQRRPGGGLGRPIELPDPLHDQRWPILCGFAVTLALGAAYTMRTTQRADRLKAARLKGVLPVGADPRIKRNLSNKSGRRRTRAVAASLR